MKNKILIIFLVLCVFLSACSVKGKNTSVELNDTHWVLEQINGQPVIADTLPSIFFAAIMRWEETDHAIPSLEPTCQKTTL